MDFVVRCARLPLPGETVSGASFERFPGGKGANQAVAAARLGADVRFVGCVGTDDLAAFALAGLREAGVDLGGVRGAPGPTGVALIVVADDGENQIVLAPGANASLQAEDVDIGSPDVVMCQLEIPDPPLCAAFSAPSGFRCLNAAPARPLPAGLLARADLVIVNEHEAAPVREEARGFLAVTLGAQGAVLYSGSREVARAAPPPVEVVDATGAGDAFCAALAYRLADGVDEQAALEAACAAGALAASRAGAQPSLPTAVEVDEILHL